MSGNQDNIKYIQIPRGISTTFIDDLKVGKLKFILGLIRLKSDLYRLEIRDNYISVYYRGGELIRIEEKSSGNYKFVFDTKYCNNKKTNKSNINILSNINENNINKLWNIIIDEMDAYLNEHKKNERDYQHNLSVSEESIIDIEFAINFPKSERIENKELINMRLDMLTYYNGVLYLVENKYGNNAIGQKAGVSKHYKDMASVISHPVLTNLIKQSVANITENKFALGLTDKIVRYADIKTIKILFIIANYDSRGTELNQELKKIMEIRSQNRKLVKPSAYIAFIGDGDGKIHYQEGIEINSKILKA